MGFLFLIQGKEGEAVSYLRKAESLAPNDSDLNEALNNPRKN